MTCQTKNFRVKQIVKKIHSKSYAVYNLSLTASPHPLPLFIGPQRKLFQIRVSQRKKLSGKDDHLKSLHTLQPPYQCISNLCCITSSGRAVPNKRITHCALHSLNNSPENTMISDPSSKCKMMRVNQTYDTNSKRSTKLLHANSTLRFQQSAMRGSCQQQLKLSHT